MVNLRQGTLLGDQYQSWAADRPLPTRASGRYLEETICTEAARQGRRSMARCATGCWDHNMSAMHRTYKAGIRKSLYGVSKRRCGQRTRHAEMAGSHCNGAPLARLRTPAEAWASRSAKRSK